MAERHGKSGLTGFDKMAENKLSRDHQIFIIEQLSSREKPSNVVKMLAEQFRVEVTRQTVHRYD